ncbi:MAG: YfcE family phosphodiesterase [bacterium]|nr:YfcE family phosphodiesterase [bacterium]
MVIGICSDSHNCPGPLRRALAIFDEVQAQRVIHCGDVGGQATFDELVGREVRFVWGNTDSPNAALRAYLQTVGLTPPNEVPLLVEWAGKRMAVFHGHEHGFRNAARSLDVDYIFHGHSHLRRDERIGAVRIINPGALHRAAIYTVATLNLATDELRFHEVRHGQ